MKVGENINQGKILDSSDVSKSRKCTKNIHCLYFEIKTSDNTKELINFFQCVWPSKIGSLSPREYSAISQELKAAHLNTRTGQ